MTSQEYGRIRALIIETLSALDNPTPDESFNALEDLHWTHRIERYNLSSALRQMLYANEIKMGPGLQPILTERQLMTPAQITEVLYIYDRTNPDREFTVEVGEEEMSLYGDYYSTVTFTNCKTQEVESYNIDTRPMSETILTPLEVLKEAHTKRLLNAKIRQEMQAIKDIYGPDEIMETNQ